MYICWSLFKKKKEYHNSKNKNTFDKISQLKKLFVKIAACQIQFQN
jgi:hypothetical protein